MSDKDWQTEEDEKRLPVWRSLTNSQRATLAADMSRGAGRQRWPSMSIASHRVLRRRGLDGAEGRALFAWADRRGYARWDESAGRPGAPEWKRGAWVVWSPDLPRRATGKIDNDRLAALIGQGMHGAAIAEELGVSREGVRVAAKRLGLTLPSRPKKVKPSKPPRVLRPGRLVFHVSDDERAAIEKAAAEAGEPVAEYVRGRALL